MNKSRERVEDREVPSTLRRNKLRIASGWSPRSMRKSKNGMDGSRKAKRTRLGNSKQRSIYISAHGYMHPEYGAICRRADKLNGR